MTVVSSEQTYETPAPVAERIVEAAASLIASQGLHATSVDDIAAAAGCGRATVYRWYPGGRAELLDVTLDRGVDRIFDECARRIVGAPSLTEAAAITVNVAVLWLAGDAVVQQLLADAPDTFASLISPMRLEPLLERAAQFGLDHFCRFTDPLTAAWAGEWCARVVTDHLRSPAPVVDLTDPAISRRFAESFLVPPSPVP
ncbi:MAG: TetR/AcrR family transcriptional regulator [Acidimicrobiia bacterium]